MFQSYLIVALPKQGFEVAASIMDKAVYSTAKAKLEKKGLTIRRAILKKKIPHMGNTRSSCMRVIQEY